MLIVSREREGERPAVPPRKSVGVCLETLLKHRGPRMAHCSRGTKPTGASADLFCGSMETRRERAHESGAGREEREQPFVF